jgi:RNA-binding protein YhbY
VVQVIVAEVEVTAAALTEVITGADSTGVVKVKFADAARRPAEFADIAA